MNILTQKSFIGTPDEVVTDFQRYITTENLAAGAFDKLKLISAYTAAGINPFTVVVSVLHTPVQRDGQNPDHECFVAMILENTISTLDREVNKQRSVSGRCILKQDIFCLHNQSTGQNQFCWFGIVRIQK